MGNTGGEETTWMEGKCPRFRNKGFHFSLDPTAQVFMVDFSSSCSACALVAMVTILYRKKQNTVRYCKGLFVLKNQTSPEVWWGKQHNLSLAGQLG